MENSEIATSAQLLQLVAKFSQVLPLDAHRAEVQQAIEDKNDPLWVAVKERFAVKKIVKKWTEKDGVIYFSLPATDGRTGKEWKKSFALQSKRISCDAEAILDSGNFISTTDVVYKIAAIRGTFWQNNNRLTKVIQTEGDSRGWLKLQPEAVCLIREYFSDADLKEMGLWYIVGMHKPVGFAGGLRFLSSTRGGEGRLLDAHCANHDEFHHDHNSAFAFGLSQEN